MSMHSSSYATVEDARLAHAVVKQQALPDFVSGFDIEFGEFDGDPALWVKFRLKDEVGARGIGPDGRYSERLTQRLDAMDALNDAVKDGLIRAFPARWPYIHFLPPVPAAAAKE